MRVGSVKTSIASVPTANAHGWVLCGLAANTAAAIAPSGPGVSCQRRHGSWAGPLPGSSTAES